MDFLGQKKQKTKFVCCLLLVVATVFCSFLSCISPKRVDSVSETWESYAGYYDTIIYSDEEAAYLIYTAEQLAYMAKQINAGVDDWLTRSYKLMADINLSGLLWKPISYVPVKIDIKWGEETKITNCTFGGTFDGNGHTIFGLNVNTYDSVGLFGNAASCTIKNLIISGASVWGGVYSSAICGFVVNSTIENCVVTGSIIQGANDDGDLYVGGLVGKGSSCIIKDCYTYDNSIIGHGNVSKLIYNGGIAGYISKDQSAVEIKNCYNYRGNVYSYTWYYETAYSGGIVGYADGVEISDCYNTASIRAGVDFGIPSGVNYNTSQVQYAYAGGIAGALGNVASSINRCYNCGDISANAVSDSRCGGIVGYVAENAVIKQCMVTSNVTSGTDSSNQSSAGGIVGEAKSSYIYDCGVYSNWVTANAKTGTYSDTGAAETSSDPEGYLSIEKKIKKSVKEKYAYAGGFCGYAASVTISECFSYYVTTTGGYREVQETHMYSTNEFAGVRGKFSIAPLPYWNYTYTYYKFSFDIVVAPVTTTYVGYSVGYCADSNCSVSTSYEKGSSNSIPDANFEIKPSVEFANFVAMRGSTKKKYARPDDVVTGTCTEQFAIAGIDDAWASTDDGVTICKIVDPIWYYGVKGSSSITFQGQKHEKQEDAFEAIFGWIIEETDDDGIDEYDEGLKLFVEWDFIYGWDEGTEEYVYQNTVVDRTSFYVNYGISIATYTSSVSYDSYWGKSSSIYNGYPVLKCFYWQLNAETPA